MGDKRTKWGKENTYYIASSNASTYAQKSRAISIQVPIQSITKEISVSTPNPVPAVPKGIDKNYQTTEIPLLTPTPIPVLPEGIEKSYNVCAKGEDILAIKKRLKELGYYSKGSSLGSTYNDTMVERVKLFQIDNKLEATGILDYSTLLLLFSKDVSSSAKGNNSPTSSPINKAPIIDSAFSLTIPSGSICESHIDNAGNLKCRFQIRNTAQKKTAVEFEIYVYTKNASGVPLLGEGKFISVTTKKKVKPGETVFTDYVSIPNGDSVARIYVAISKIKYSDGNIVSYPSMYPKYVSWSFN